MRKINLLFMALMLMFASGVFSQDIVYLDFDRSGWTAIAPAYSPTDNAVGGDVAGAKYLLDDKTTTFLALVKPGKTYSSIAGPDNITDLGFVINMGSAQLFDYFRVQFRTGNIYDYLRPWKVSIYGSNDANPTFISGTWTQISDKNANTIITLPNAEGNGGTYTSGNIDLDNEVSYKFIKVVYQGMSTSTSGSTLQLAEFFAGKTTTDKVIENPGDVSFGDIEAGVTVQEELPIRGFNLNNLSYTISGDGASAFSYAKAGTATSTSDTILITFAPTEKKLYTADLTINMTGVLEAQTIKLTGNADFNLPVQISSVDASNEHWYYIQFTRQAAKGTVLTMLDSGEDGDSIKQLPLNESNELQQWKVTGTWDNYKLINKLNKSIYYKYAEGVEDPLTGIVPADTNLYVTKTNESSDKFGFVRYQTTDTWQLKNTSTTLAVDNKIYLNDQSGVYAGTYTLNNAGNQLTFIDASAAQIIVAADTVALGSVKQYGRETLSTIVKSIGLTGNITVAISNDADGVFSLKTTSLSAGGDNLEIIFEPKSYKKISYATITLTSGSVTKTFVISATSNTGVSKYYVGTTNQWGTPVDGEIVETMPTLKAGDVVWIAQIVDTVAQVTVPANVSIYGGFAGTEKSVDERVVGSKPWVFTNASVLRNKSSLIFSITGANVVIDGVTLEGTSTTGRAIQNTSSSALGVIIRNNIIKNFSSSADGGGMNIRYQTEIYNCLITGNSGNKGGGAYLDGVTIHDCEITNNSVPTTATSSIGNVNGGGGGLLLVASEAYNLYIEGNLASYGGGLFPRTTSKVYNSIIVNNTATSGGGISFDERDTGTLVYNVTIANNKASGQAKVGGVNFAANTDSRTAKLYNSILWNNTDIEGEIYNIGLSGTVDATPEMKNIIIDDLSYYVGENANLAIIDGIAETESSVLFTSTDTWETAATSPGREKGLLLLSEEVVDPETSEILTPATYLEFATDKDYAGNQRVVGTIDIGPFEYNIGSGVVNPKDTVDGKVIATKYYNIQGIEVTVPSETGIYIKKDILDTNKIRVTKFRFVKNQTKL